MYEKLIKCAAKMQRVLKRYRPIPRRHEIKNSPDRGLRSSLTLTLTSDDLESHIFVNVSSTSIIIPSSFRIGRRRFSAKFDVT